MKNSVNYAIVPSKRLVERKLNEINPNLQKQNFIKFSDAYEKGFFKNSNCLSQVSTFSKSGSNRYFHDLGKVKVCDTIQLASEYSKGNSNNECNSQKVMVNSNRRVMLNSTKKSNAGKNYITNKHSLFCARRDLLEEFDIPGDSNKGVQSQKMLERTGPLVSYKRVSTTLGTKSTINLGYERNATSNSEAQRDQSVRVGFMPIDQANHKKSEKTNFKGKSN